MGMILSTPMVLVGLWAIWRAQRQAAHPSDMNRLGQKIARLIQSSGPISVADYMMICLFDPDDGYYTTRDPFGAGGDFVTAPEVSQMFGELVGVWLVAAWQAARRPTRLSRSPRSARAVAR